MAQPHRIVEVPSYRQLGSKSLLAFPQDSLACHEEYNCNPVADCPPSQVQIVIAAG
jgi:hypothetical protein